MKKIPFLNVLLITLLVSPSLVFAQTAAQSLGSGIGTIAALITGVTQYIGKAVATLLLTAGMIVFFYGIVEYVLGVRGGDPKKIETGNSFMKWGLLALFVMFSVYGIINFGQSIIFGKSIDTTTIKIPDISFGQSKNQIGTAGPTSNKYSSPIGLPGATSDTGGSSVNGTTLNGRTPSAGGSGYGTGGAATKTGSAASSRGVLGGSGTGSKTSPSGSASYGGDGGCGYGYTPSESGDCVDMKTGAPQPADTADSSGVCPKGYLPDDNARSGCSPAEDASASDSSSVSSGESCGDGWRYDPESKGCVSDSSSSSLDSSDESSSPSCSSYSFDSCPSSCTANESEDRCQ
jgi:hypothetical protein